MELQFTVEGKPEPRGSKKAFPFKRRDGRLGVAVTDDNPKSSAWMALVRKAALKAMKEQKIPMLFGALKLTVCFRLPRPKSHFNRVGLKPGAPLQPIVRPDATKLLRGVEDAMTEIVWKDDAQVVVQEVRKCYVPANVADASPGFVDVKVETEDFPTDEK